MNAFANLLEAFSRHFADGHTNINSRQCKGIA